MMHSIVTDSHDIISEYLNSTQNSEEVVQNWHKAYDIVIVNCYVFIFVTVMPFFSVMILEISNRV